MTRSKGWARSMMAIIFLYAHVVIAANDNPLDPGSKPNSGELAVSIRSEDHYSSSTPLLVYYDGAHDRLTDRFRLVSMGAILLGMSSEWGIYTMGSVFDYFQEEYPTVDAPNILASVVTWPSLITILLMGRLSAQFSDVTNVSISLPIMIIAVACIPFMSLWDAPFLGIAIANFFLGGASSTMALGALSFTSQFSSSYTKAFLLGQGIGDVIVGFVLVLLRFFLGSTDTTINIFFGIAVVVTVLSLVWFRMMLSLTFTRHHLRSRLVSPFGDDHAVLSSAVMSEKVSNERWIYAGMIVVMSTGTSMIVPGLLYGLRSSRIPSSWLPLLLVTTYNLLNMIGLALPSSTSRRRQSQLWSLSCLRLLLYPIFVMHKARWFPSVVADVVAFASAGGVALSDGLLFSAIVLSAMSTMNRGDSIETSAIMLFSNQLGTSIGLAISMLMHRLFPAYL